MSRFTPAKEDRGNQSEDEARRLERERNGRSLARKRKRAKRNKKIAIITTSIVCAIIAFIIVLNTVIIPNGKYEDTCFDGSNEV